MANTFEFCGKIVLGKDSEKFHPIDERVFTSGWMSTTLKFNCVSGTNRVSCMTQGGKWKDDKKNVVKTFSKSTKDANGNVTKGTMIEIPWDKRFDKDQIDKVAGFKKFVVDTGDSKMRYKLQDIIKAFENGKVTDEMMEEIGIFELEDAKQELEKSMAKKKEFLTEWDFVEHLIKVAKADKFKNKLFKISGNYDISYNADKDTFYRNYHVNRVALVDDNAEQKTELNVNFYYDENCWDDSVYDVSGKCIVNGWVSYYDNNLKKIGFANLPVAIRGDEELFEWLKYNVFTCGEGIKEIGLVLSVIDGAEFVEITMETLDEATRKMIEIGVMKFEAVKKARGGKNVGNTVREIRFETIDPNKADPHDTDYTIDDMHPAREDIIEKKEDDDGLINFNDDDEL